MTLEDERKESIEYLKLLLECAVKSHNDTAVLDVKLDSFQFSIELAIKVLERIGNLIFRDDAIAEIYDYFMSSDGEIHNEAVRKCMEIIRNLPPKTGRWIICNYPGHECVYCSECKEEYYEDDLYMGGSEFPKYCPSCGKRMESE